VCRRASNHNRAKMIASAVMAPMVMAAIEPPLRVFPPEVGTDVEVGVGDVLVELELLTVETVGP
jgi:hypothetical protein